MKKLNLFLFILIAVSFFNVSCDKDSSNSANYDQQQALAQNYAFIQDVYSDIFDLLCQASGDSALMASHSGTISDATVNYNPLTKTFVFTFSAKSTNAKNGEFTAELDGDFQEVGTVAKITFNNYKVGGNLIQGSNNIINKGKIDGKKTTGTIINYSDSVNAQIIKGGETINVSALYNVEWMIGDSTILSDDQYWFSGNISGSVNPNKSFTATVLNNSTDRVLYTPECLYIQRGIINAVMNTLDENNNPKQTTVGIDFGTVCDNMVKITMQDGTIANFPM